MSYKPTKGKTISQDNNLPFKNTFIHEKKKEFIRADVEKMRREMCDLVGSNDKRYHEFLN